MNIKKFNSPAENPALRVNKKMIRYCSYTIYYCNRAPVENDPADCPMTGLEIIVKSKTTTNGNFILQDIGSEGLAKQ